MVSHSFDQLVADIKQCNEQLMLSESHTLATPIVESESDVAKQQDVENAWQQTLDVLEQRAVCISQLSSLFNTLNQSQIDIVAQLYQSIIESNVQSVNWARLEQLQTRNALRAIKNAEKALPLYKAHKTSQ